MTWVVTTRRWAGAAAIASLLAVVSGCSGPQEETDPADASASSVSPEPRTFTSERLAFQMDVPQGWSVYEGYTDWQMGAPPHRGTPPFDTIRSEASDPWILVGLQELSPRETLERWIAQLRATDTITYPYLCEAPERAKSGTLGGEPARLIAFRCPDDFPDAIGIQVLAVHGRRGYLALCYSEEAAGGLVEVLLADCKGWLSNFRFVD